MGLVTREDRPSLSLERQSFLGDRSNHWNRGDLQETKEWD